ncbi:YoaK family protein [Tomitella cavernea]|uniref:YoaK family protein n=1 Tax=Tomitella cavernea TaxID=1387982 RepID=A0ABP9C1A5_9ACTN|nr:YoaK family protein [Tomitella cavernea]
MNSPRKTEIATASALAGLAGFVDAVGFMKIGGYFVAFMSGNTTLAGVSLAEGRFHDFGLAAGLVITFVLGVIAGSLLGRSVGGDGLPHRRRMSVVLTAVAVILLAAVLAEQSTTTAVAVAPLLALAMGVENAVFEHDGKVTIGLTYMTGTLVKLGQSIAALIAREPASPWRRYLTLWGGLGAGTVIGAVSYLAIGTAALWLTVAAAAMAGAALWLTPTLQFE